jgi:hypothetical protein
MAISGVAIHGHPLRPARAATGSSQARPAAINIVALLMVPLL